MSTSDALPAPQSEDTLAPDSETAASEGSGSLWLWIAGGLALLAALIAGLFLVRRRSAVAEPPEIVRPVVPRSPTTASEPATDHAPEPSPVAADRGPARVDLELEIVTATRSMMNFTLDYRLTLANRTPNAVRDVTVAAILTSAQRGAPNTGDLGFDRPEPESIARIGPNKSHAITGQAQLPTSKLQVLRQGNKPLYVPLLQVTVTQGDGEPVTRHYVIGVPSAAGTARLHPLPLDTPPGGIPDVRARELDIQPA